jgi:hypothetical protein
MKALKIVYTFFLTKIVYAYMFADKHNQNHKTIRVV